MPHQGPSTKNIRFFGPFFDLPTYPYLIFSYLNVCFSIVISDFQKLTNLTKNEISFLNAPLCLCLQILLSSRIFFPVIFKSIILRISKRIKIKIILLLTWNSLEILLYHNFVPHLQTTVNSLSAASNQSQIDAMHINSERA